MNILTLGIALFLGVVFVTKPPFIFHADHNHAAANLSSITKASDDLIDQTSNCRFFTFNALLSYSQYFILILFISSLNWKFIFPYFSDDYYSLGAILALTSANLSAANIIVTSKVIILFVQYSIHFRTTGFNNYEYNFQ